MPILETLKRRRRRFYKSLILGLSVSLITSLVSYMGYLQSFEAKALDFLLWLRGSVKSPEIVLVQIDDQAFSRVVPVFVVRPEKEVNGRMLYSRAPFFSPTLPVLSGFANAPIDPDGVFRQLPLAVRASDGKTLASLALAVLARYAGYDGARLEAEMNRAGEVTLKLPEWDKFQGRLLPEPTALSFAIDEQWKINFAGAEGSFAAIPSDLVFQISKMKAALAEDNPFRNKIVLIGASFGDSRDFFATPRGLMAGVEIHANIIHTILSRAQIMPARRWVAVALSLVFTLVMSLLLTFFRPLTATIVSLTAIPLVLIPLSYLAFARLGVWVDFVVPLVAIRWGASIADYMEARHVRRSLGQYVDDEVADQIVDQDESLSGRTREATVFFTDVRNYTTLCEGLPPERVVRLLNELFAMMSKSIAAHGGCIVDFVGDAVLAAFGAHKESPGNP